MDTTNAVVLTAVVVGMGQWAKKDKGPSVKIVVGGMALAVMLAALSNANEKLASQFATLILVGAVIVYVEPITKKLGFSK